MTTGHGPPATAATRSSKRPLKRKAPTTLAPLASTATAANQRDGHDDNHNHDRDHDGARRLPLELVFRSRFRHLLRTHVDLSGWEPVDADLRVLLAGRDVDADGAQTSIHSLTLDGCARVTVAGLRLASPVLQHLTALSVRHCSALSADAIALLPASLLELDLSYCDWLDDHSVRSLARRCVALRKVSLQHCRRLTDYGVSAFADTATTSLSLTELNVSLLPRVSDTCLLALLMRCAKLQRLRASGLSSFQGLGLQGLSRNSAPSLQSLDLSHNARMHALTAAHLLRVLHVGTLTEVDVSHCAQVTDDTLVALGRYAPSLRVLRLAFCSQLTDIGVTRLVRFVPLESDQLADFVDGDASRPRCRKLTELDLTGCYLITSDGITAVASHCATLEILLVDGLRRLDRTALSALAATCPTLHTLHWGGILIQSGAGDDLNATGFFSVPTLDREAARAISRMRALRTLRVGATKCDVDALARSLATVGPQLRDLDASGVATDVLCLAVAAHCTQLRTLRLSRSRYFSQAAFLAVAAACTELRALDLESCEQLDDLALTTLARHCRQLERLVLSNDWQISDRGIAMLAQRCPSLRRLQLRHCPEVSQQGVRSAAMRNPFVVATRDGLEPKPAPVAAFVRLDREMDAAARQLTRWLREMLADRSHSKSSIERALRHVRKRRRCVVRIQHCIRRWLAHRRHLALVEEAKRARQRQVDANWRWITAYCLLGRLLRHHLRRWLVHRHELVFRCAEAEQARRQKAAGEVQRVYWGWKGRQCATRQREQHEATRRLREENVRRLQRVWRGVTGRRVARVHADANAQRLLHAVCQCERKALAALTLSRAARGFLGRRRRHRRVAWLEETNRRRDQSATAIQRSARAYLVRVMFRRRHERGAMALQRVFRGYRDRRRARCIVLTRAFARAPVLLLLSARSIFSHDLAVAWKAKRDAGERVALSLQCWFRGYFGGRLPRRRLLAARRQLEFERDAGARCLQHFFRSLIIIRHLAKLQCTLTRRRRSATTIQAAWRMWLGKVHATAAALRRDRQRRHDATLASLSSANSSDSRRLLQFGAVHALVITYRHSLASRSWQTPTLVRFHHRCATMIQSLIRGHQTRLWIVAIREQLTWAARLVQRAWRGKLGRKQWRLMVAESRRQLRLQEELDRAARIAHKLTGQFVLDANARNDANVRVLQRWMRTLHKRQLFKRVREVREAELRTKAAERLGSVLRLSTESVVFQARVWRECLDRKQQLSDMKRSDVRVAELEIAALKRACLEDYAAYATATVQYAELARRKRDAPVLKKRLHESAASMKQTIQPFAEQAKRLTMESARVHVANRNLQDELRRVEQSVAKFHAQLQTALPLEPLLYEHDVDALVELLGLPEGKLSLLQDQLDEPFNDASDFVVSDNMFAALAIASLSWVLRVDAQVIAAPDKGDELEVRAFVEGQDRLDDELRAREPDTVIDINVYSYEAPTQFVVGLLLDPCRNRNFDCCSDRFGEPMYTTDALAAEEKISLLDESGTPLQVSASRLSDRPSLFDRDCYVDTINGSLYRLLKVHTTSGLRVSKQYANSGCVGRLRALAPLEVVVMPPCWDRNSSINALASCYGVDGRKQINCVSVAYMQTGLIVQCFGAYALDNHCGTFLELHEPDSEVIISQTRLLGEYTSGFRVTTLPLFFQGDRARTICRGAYEIWWVQRTRYNLIVQQKKKFRVVDPPCDFDFATNAYKHFHVLAT